jgi:endonuclease/exonuclease/phosphatase family metal-dependent hydrolase
MSRNTYIRLVEWTSVFLFFIQALRVIFSVLFGIIYDGVFEGPFTLWLVISILLLLLGFIFPMLVSNRLRHEHLTTIAILTTLARVMLSINVAEVRYWGALLTLLFGGLYLATAFRSLRHLAAIGIVAALCLDQFFRVLGHTYDVGLRSWWIPVQLLWVLLLFVGGAQLRKGEEKKTNAGLGMVGGLALGCFLFLQTSLLSLPNAIARWSDASYEVITPILLLITLAFLLPELPTQIATALGKNGALKLLAFVALVLGLMAGYFWVDFLAVLGLMIANAASIALLFYFINGMTAPPQRSGYAFSLSSVVILILNFLNAFTFTYSYTLPVLREMGWAIYLAAGILLGLVLFIGNTKSGEEYVEMPKSILLPMALVIIVAVLIVWPIRIEDLSSAGTLRIATYNIHYGYDDAWHFTLEQMAETIEENNCDVVALQEVDTGRMTSYGVDDAFYLAHRLKMNVAYLPTVEYLTGIGVLYRGTSALETSELLTSLQEQTGIIGVTLGNGSHPLNVYGTWLGLSNEDTQRQISEALDFIGDKTPSTFGGDFNATYEDIEAQAIRDAGFIDPFTELGIEPVPNTAPAIDPEKRIDFVWIRGLTPTGAWVSESLASDHRMVVVEVVCQP